MCLTNGSKCLKPKRRVTSHPRFHCRGFRLRVLHVLVIKTKRLCPGAGMRVFYSNNIVFITYFSFQTSTDFGLFM